MMKRTVKEISAPFAFEWARDLDGYALSKDKRLIRRLGGTMRAYSPDGFAPPVHHVFAAGDYADDDAEWALGFVKQYGFLGSIDRGADAKDEPVEWIVNQRRRLAAFVDLLTVGPLSITNSRGKKVDVYELFNANVSPHMTIRLEQGSADAYRITVVPRSLISWMWLHVAHELAGDIHAKTCERTGCNKIFYVGRWHKTERRKYCSDNCRVLSNYHRKRAVSKSKARIKS